jgi:hypothetical protein
MIVSLIIVILLISALYVLLYSIKKLLIERNCLKSWFCITLLKNGFAKEYIYKIIHFRMKFKYCSTYKLKSKTRGGVCTYGWALSLNLVRIGFSFLLKESYNKYWAIKQ